MNVSLLYMFLVTKLEWVRPGRREKLAMKMDLNWKGNRTIFEFNKAKKIPSYADHLVAMFKS